MSNTGTEVKQLISDLTCNDVIRCQSARKALVELGEPAVESLKQALEHKDHWVHWEAAKALSQIGSPRAASVLIEMLDNQEFELRWLAAEGLASIGDSAVNLLLNALIAKPGSPWIREGAHHVFLDARLESAQALKPVLKAIEGPEPSVRTSIEAAKALEAIRKKKRA